MAQKPGSFIRVDEFLAVGDYISSPNGLYYAIMQDDGNFCVYRGSGSDDRHGGAMWSANKTGSGGQFFAYMQGDGNFCIYPGTGPGNDRLWGATWCTKSFGPGGQFFAYMQDDGNFCIYEGTSDEDQGDCIWNAEVSDPVVDFDDYDIEYDLNAAKTEEQIDRRVERFEFINKDSVDTKWEIRRTVSITETSNWENSIDVGIGVKTTIKTGIPFLSEGKIEVSAKFEYGYDWGGETKRTTEIEVSYDAKVPASSKATYTVMATESLIKVPYSLAGTLIFKSGRRMPGRIKGVYEGIDSSNLQYIYETFAIDKNITLEKSSGQLKANSKVPL